MAINFFSEDTGFVPRGKRKRKDWIRNTVLLQKKDPGKINIIFTSREVLLDLNKNHLKKNYHTDVITFEYNEGNVVSGDIFIGIEQVEENSRKYHASLDDEIDRVIIHGVLHLCGYRDRTLKERDSMRSKEDECLARR